MKGWLSPEMPDVFTDFADFVFGEYAGKVKYWVTLNEADLYCSRMMPDNHDGDPGRAALCLHLMILGHAKAHKAYHDNHGQNGGRSIPPCSNRLFFFLEST